MLNYLFPLTLPLDHVLGRPSVKFRKIQVLAVVFVWSSYLLRSVAALLEAETIRPTDSGAEEIDMACQTLVITLLWLYVTRNFGKLVGLESPEPLANLYSRSFFRATWITTAMDAGFWSAMRIRTKWVRDICSIVFTAYYLVCAEQADEKVRKVRAIVTVDHLRVSWNKATTPYLGLVTRLLRPRLMRFDPRAIRIPRPEESSYPDHVNAWLFFDGPLSHLKQHTRVILNVPGGGFVAMNPRTHDDSLMAWAGQTGLPVLSLDYKKAPDFPYPYALNECYDVYQSLINTRGRCIGLSGKVVPEVVISGDSAGGNLAASTVLMILQSGSTDARRWHGEGQLPKPAGLVLMYPSLDLNIGNWMTDEQMGLIRDKDSRGTNRGVLRRKTSEYRKLTPSTPHHSDDEDENSMLPKQTPPGADELHVANGKTVAPPTIKTRLAVPSLISYFSDRVLTPEMMRAMIILYIGPHSRPDFSTEYLLSPVLAPEQLLARFPKTYFMTGERDPLVDDTVIMAGRIRQAKKALWKERRELGALTREERRRGWREEDHLQVTLIEGISHGFIQFSGIFPEAWRYIHRVARWYEDAFASAAFVARSRALGLSRGGIDKDGLQTGRHHFRSGTQSSADDDNPLEMSSSTANRRSSSGKHQRSGTESLSPEEPLTPAAGLAREHAFVSDLHRSTKSLVSLTSEDDLVARRMRGLADGLTTSEDVAS
ncbi:MAG: hypothetical protein M1828_004047 [Chrysothrix sp. TS-e1954]|nr:MAG: hypothetical protein M1828_004047 [Chrysothrix sp. TS-e1954]